MSKKPVPSKKQAVSSTKSRHSKYALVKRTKMAKKYVLDTCPQTGETKLRHFASPSGNYKGKNVFTPKSANKAIQAIEA